MTPGCRHRGCAFAGLRRCPKRESQPRCGKNARWHVKSGNLGWECPIEPDWLLIYKLELEEAIFERTGTHSNLFE
ncbi:MAG: type II toxin-antitoxin system YafQ family toxin [bacterium]